MGRIRGEEQSTYMYVVVWFEGLFIFWCKQINKNLGKGEKGQIQVGLYNMFKQEAI